MGLEKGIWFRIRQRISGVLVRSENGVEVVYMLCEPSSHYYKVMTRSDRITVMAVDSNGNVDPSYTGTVVFRSTDPYPAVLPNEYAFTSSDQGVHTFTGGVTLFTAGTQTLTVQDTSDSSITGSATITVSPSSASAIHLTAPSTTVAGTVFNVTVTAFDAYGNVATGYTGTVILTSSDHEFMSSEYTFAQSDGGTHTFSARLFIAGTQTVVVQDAENGAFTKSATVAVQASQAEQFLVTAPSTVSSGVQFEVIVIAVDSYGNIATNYQGTVTLTSTDTAPGVTLPTPYTFTIGSEGDNGVHDFVGGVTLVMPGNQTITVSDAANAITGNATVTVSPPPGGDASKPQTPITNVGQPVHRLVLLDRLFAALNVESPPATRSTRGLPMLDLAVRTNCSVQI
jgi:hypothetical protein